MAHNKNLIIGSIFAISTYSAMSYGAGFAIIEQSVTGLGRSFAGSAVVAEDASTIFFNPAGLTNLRHAEVDVAMNYIAPQSDFTNNGSTTAFGTALTGGNGGDAGEDAYVPNFYYSRPLNDRMVFGLGINAPFGLVTEYNDTWAGRYHAVKSDLKTVNINPSFAFKPTDKLSIGLGVDVQKIDLQLTQMADLAASAAIRAGAPLATVAAVSQTSDGKVNIEADDWSWGYNLGLTYQATHATRLAVAYRSKITHSLKGYGTITQVSTGTQVANGNVSGKVTLPESLSLAIHHQLNEQWSLAADATWTRWSRFENLTINSDGSLPSSSKAENWSNSMRYGLGVTYVHSEKWTFRSGVAFDETPVSDQYRTPRIPDEDRKWLSIGASYNYSKNITIDAGYAHLFVNDPKINDSDSRNYTLVGRSNASVDIAGIQLRWLFL